MRAHTHTHDTSTEVSVRDRMQTMICVLTFVGYIVLPERERSNHRSESLIHSSSVRVRVRATVKGSSPQIHRALLRIRTAGRITLPVHQLRDPKRVLGGKYPQV